MTYRKNIQNIKSQQQIVLHMTHEKSQQQNDRISYDADRGNAFGNNKKLRLQLHTCEKEKKTRSRQT